MVKIVGSKIFQAIPSANAGNVSIYVDSADNYAKFKTSGGLIKLFDATPKSATLVQNTISVTTSSTLIKASNSSRLGMIIKNYGTATLYVGVTGVTTSTGTRIKPGNYIYIYDTAAIYGVASAGTIDVRYLEV